MPALVHDVSFEHHREPFGIGESAPRISWKVSTERPGWRQRAYEIEIRREPETGAGRAIEAAEAAEAGAPWTSGRIESDECLLVPWPGDALRSRDRLVVRVRVWASGGATGEGEARPSAWTEWSPVEIGLLHPTDWQAVLVEPERSLPDRDDWPPVLFRRDFAVSGDVAAARLYVTAHGVYEVEINGRRVGDHVLAPGWTSYHQRLRYQSFDVTATVQAGENHIRAAVAEGWYCGHLGFHGGRSRIWGEEVALLAQLEIRYADGRSETIATDGSWTWANGPFLGSGIYAGETYDARREPGEWKSVRVAGREKAELIAPMGPPIRRTQEIEPVAVTRSPSGKPIVDFGQDLVGRVRFRVEGQPGDTITLRHAEVLEDGEIATRPLRGAAAVDRYTLRGHSEEEWEPAFTYHGFRYVEVTGWPGSTATESAAPDASAIRAIVIHTDMQRTGWFECSNALLNRLHENIVWTMRGNFMDVPTDCPQRDERLGWGGDLGVFLPTATFLYDCSGMLSSWLGDVAAEQRALGTIPFWIPWFQITFPLVPSSVWGDVGVIAPWVLYRRFGDLEILRRQFRSMKAWVDQIEGIAGPSHLWQSGLHLGDWLDPSAPADAPEAAKTDKYYIATAYHALVTRLVARTAALLGATADAARYGKLADDVAAAFRAEYTTPNGQVTSDAQTAYALALEFDLLEPEQRSRAQRRLTEIVRDNGFRIGTGFVGGRVIGDALTNAGEVDAAYHMLTRTDNPSWLYAVTMGATTIWERWDSMLPDGRLNPGDMLSFNHYALGAIGDWINRSVAGLAPAEAGYRRILVAPRPGGGLSYARAIHETPFGRAKVAWHRAEGKLVVFVDVPPGSTALIHLPEPGWRDVEAGAGSHRFECSFRDPAEDPQRPAPAQTLGLPPETTSGVFGG